MGSFDKQTKKYLFVILSVLGWSKLLDLDWLSQKFPGLNIFAQKKIITVNP